MRPLSFPPDVLHDVLLRNKIATLPELKHALGTQVALTVFRKLKPMGYLSSYSHGGRYYTLREIARFDSDGLWSHRSVWFSSHGTLLATVADFVQRSLRGCFAEELAVRLQVGVHDALLQLVEQQRITRQRLSGVYLYSAAHPATQRRQLLARRELPALPGGCDVSALQISPDELKAAIILFYSLLDERQRRLYAGLEALKLGHGGDRHLAQLLGLDAHTVSRGRRELLAQEVQADRVRHRGAGRPAMEKNARTNPCH